MPLPVRRHTDVLREATGLAGRAVLEVGCGGGRLLGWLLREGAWPIGLDPDPAQLARARGEAPGVPLVAGVGEALRYAGPGHPDGGALRPAGRRRISVRPAPLA